MAPIRRVARVADIWTTMLNDRDVQRGIDYGTISLHWTYDRMGAQARGNFGKAIFRIALGKAIQSAWERLLEERDIVFTRDTTDYRTEDYWDLETDSRESLDLKTSHIHTDSPVKERPQFSLDHLVNSSTGEDWRTFFPMLVPIDQFDTDPKDIYVFAVLLAPSSKRYPRTRAAARFLMTLPYSKEGEAAEACKVIRRRSFAEERIRAGRGFALKVTRVDRTTLFRGDDEVRVTVGFADLSGTAQKQIFVLSPAKSGTLSSIAAVQFLRIEPQRSAIMSNVGAPILQLDFTKVDRAGDFVWFATPESFEDIWIYDATVHFIGWLKRDEFDAARRKRPAYGANARYDGNSPHRDPAQAGALARRSFCYFYPPAYQGGTQNPNYYCLPRDLSGMESLVEYLARSRH